MKRAIVLSGGGSKGAYQIGVWKALKKLNITYDIVTGTSVGALNAALMVQKDYMRSLWLWYNIDFSKIFEQKITADYHTKEGKTKIIHTYLQAALDGGMAIDQLEHTVEHALNLKKLYKSPIDLGIVTVKLSTLKPILLTKKEISPPQLKDYLIASASCFPAFQKKKIGTEDYIDGGLYDNLPINLAISMGATEVIAVDLKEIGIKKTVKNKDIPITYISPNNDIGSFLIFDKNVARRCIHFGYNDTMKIFHCLEGKQFTFKKNQLQINYNQYYQTFINRFQKYFHTHHSILDPLMKISILKHFLNNSESKTTIKLWNQEIERLGKAFQLEETKIYSIKKWNQCLIKHYQQLKQDQTLEEDLKYNKYKKWFHNEQMIFYLCELMKKHKNSKKLYQYVLLFPHEFIEALYMKIIIEGR